MNNQIRTYKEVLGFKEGYITIFKGDTYSELDWFKLSIARYSKFWGWYISSEDKVPDNLPIGIEPIILKWEDVSENDDEIKSEEELKKIIDGILYEPGESEWAGNIGDKIEVYITVDKCIQVEGSYGISNIITMRDDLNNIYVWNTNARTMEENKEYLIKGTIKELNIYHNQKQTQLTRCRVKEVEK